jgi:YD repeat-containing protein
MMSTTICCKNVKRFIILNLLLFLITPSRSQVISNFLEEQKITGKVRSVTELHNNGQKFIYMFNEKGLETEKWFFNPAEVLLFRLNRKFDSAGHLAEETHYDKGISPVLKIEYRYNAKGVQMGRTVFGSNQKPLEKFIYQYNLNNKIVDSSHYDYYESLIERFIWHYDSADRIVLKKWIRPQVKDTIITHYNYDTALRIIREKIDTGSGPEIRYEYDKEGRMITESRRYQEDGNDFIKKFAFDDKVNLILSAEYKPDGSIIKKITYEYDSSGRKISEARYNSQNLVFMRYIRLFDERNNEVELKGTNEAGETEFIIESKFEYDKTGNWIIKTQIVNGSQGEMITRVFEYY